MTCVEFGYFLEFGLLRQVSTSNYLNGELL